ncbi:energy transducer TonB [Psychroserpens ponticola]|uniref:Energy transducer TonB n=1 Tax=Psychroserpens ponticola TaxID=2932268 RepID=A0ABY7RZH3_9FLAO|nr:energy transducer TonB [Psychroserpens ponticola]WCO02105.1 energy transducer TonB [Psychroserpens ponticola]
MKYFILTISMLFGLLVFSQEIKLNQSELDALSTTKDTTEVIEHVPIYKGCKNEKGNTNKMNCMSQKINELFKNHFNTEMHEESDLEPGLKRIAIIFKINKEGKITNIRARAEDEYLEAEAIRVINLIPQMTPGIRDGEPIAVPYSVPVKVEITPNKNEGKTRYPIYRGCDKEATNLELEACSKRKIMNFIKMSFDIEMASRALPQAKSTQFLLEFTISKNGKIKNINAKANHKAIAIEAINVTKRLPKFKAPGTWEGIEVDTPFSMLMTLDFY